MVVYMYNIGYISTIESYLAVTHFDTIKFGLLFKLKSTIFIWSKYNIYTVSCDMRMGVG